MKFALGHPLGKKLAVILALCKYNTILWCDTDILWFRSLPDVYLLKNIEDTPFYIKVSEDLQQCYDEHLLNLSLKHLSQLRYVCTGLVLVKGDLLNNCNIKYLIEAASHKSNHFTEQTIVAEIVHQLKGEYWNRDEIALFQDDGHTFPPSYRGKPWIARHYPGVTRQLFWRDALCSRFQMKS